MSCPSLLQRLAWKLNSEPGLHTTNVNLLVEVEKTTFWVPGKQVGGPVFHELQRTGMNHVKCMAMQAIRNGSDANLTKLMCSGVSPGLCPLMKISKKSSRPMVNNWTAF
jgi:hypothetical protein